MLVLYLCGAINGCTDSEACDWREATKRELGGLFGFLDPMRRDYRGREDEPGIAAEIVRGDLEDIAASDVVLAAGDRPSWGTAMEIFHAGSTGKPVVTVCAGPRVSPWLRHHSSRICPSLSGAWGVLRQMASG